MSICNGGVEAPVGGSGGPGGRGGGHGWVNAGPRLVDQAGWSCVGEWWCGGAGGEGSEVEVEAGEADLEPWRLQWLEARGRIRDQPDEESWRFEGGHSSRGCDGSSSWSLFCPKGRWSEEDDPRCQACQRCDLAHWSYYDAEPQAAHGGGRGTDGSVLRRCFQGVLVPSCDGSGPACPVFHVGGGASADDENGDGSTSGCWDLSEIDGANLDSTPLEVPYDQGNHLPGRCWDVQTEGHGNKGLGRSQDSVDLSSTGGRIESGQQEDPGGSPGDSPWVCVGSEGAGNPDVTSKAGRHSFHDLAWSTARLDHPHSHGSAWQAWSWSPRGSLEHPGVEEGQEARVGSMDAAWSLETFDWRRLGLGNSGATLECSPGWTSEAEHQAQVNYSGDADRCLSYWGRPGLVGVGGSSGTLEAKTPRRLLEMDRPRKDPAHRNVGGSGSASGGPVSPLESVHTDKSSTAVGGQQGSCGGFEEVAWWRCVDGTGTESHLQVAGAVGRGPGREMDSHELEHSSGYGLTRSHTTGDVSNMGGHSIGPNGVVPIGGSQGNESLETINFVGSRSGGGGGGARVLLGGPSPHRSVRTTSMGDSAISSCSSIWSNAGLGSRSSSGRRGTTEIRTTPEEWGVMGLSTSLLGPSSGGDAIAESGGGRTPRTVPDVASIRLEQVSFCEATGGTGGEGRGSSTRATVGELLQRETELSNLSFLDLKNRVKSPTRLELADSTLAAKVRGLRLWLLAASGEAEDEEWVEGTGKSRMLRKGICIGRSLWRQVLMPPTRREFEVAMEVLKTKTIGNNAKNAALALKDVAELLAWEVTWTDPAMDMRHKRRSSRRNAKTIRSSVRALLPEVVAWTIFKSHQLARGGDLEAKRVHLVALLGLVGLWRMGELPGLHVMKDVLAKWDANDVVDVVPVWMKVGKTVAGVYRVARISDSSKAQWCLVRAVRAWYSALISKFGHDVRSFITMPMGEGGRGQGPLGWQVVRTLDSGRAVAEKSKIGSAVADLWVNIYLKLKPVGGVDLTPEARDESGHSLRATGALMCLSAGMSASRVKRGARWSSDAMLALYTRADVLDIGRTIAVAGARSMREHCEAALDTTLVEVDSEGGVEEGDLRLSGCREMSRVTRTTRRDSGKASMSMLRHMFADEVDGEESYSSSSGNHWQRGRRRRKRMDVEGGVEEERWSSESSASGSDFGYSTGYSYTDYYDSSDVSNSWDSSDWSDNGAGSSSVSSIDV